MQFRLLPAFILFLGSYFPLALILLVQDIPNRLWNDRLCVLPHQGESCTFAIFAHPTAALSAAALSLTALLLSRYLLSKVRLRFHATVVDAKAVPSDLISYVFPYIVSFMGINYGSPSQLAGFAIFIIFMFIMTYKSGLIVMNPLLIAFGWHIYDVTLEVDGKRMTGLALKRGCLVPGMQRMERVQGVFFLGDT